MTLEWGSKCSKINESNVEKCKIKINHFKLYVIETYVLL